MVQKEFVHIRSQFTSAEEQENIRLRAKLDELNLKLKNFNEEKSRLVRKSMNRNHVIETKINKDSKVEQLKAKLHNLVEENNMLCSTITN